DGADIAITILQECLDSFGAKWALAGVVHHAAPLSFGIGVEPASEASASLGQLTGFRIGREDNRANAVAERHNARVAEYRHGGLAAVLLRELLAGLLIADVVRKLDTIGFIAKPALEALLGGDVPQIEETAVLECSELPRGWKLKIGLSPRQRLDVVLALA